ncbi:MAG: hypothetical protein KDD14_12160, partial [Saprospiraceae bacterium]|nr:hypothetical protein [Saprospiraceae bacterium]
MILDGNPVENINANCKFIQLFDLPQQYLIHLGYNQSMRKQMRTSLFWLILIAIAIFFCGQSPNPETRRKAPKPHEEAMMLAEKAQAFLEKDELDSTLVYAQQAILLSEEGDNWYAWGKAQSAIIITAYYQGESQKVASTFS